MTTGPVHRVHVGPDATPELEESVLAAGCALSDLSGAEGVVWLGRDPAALLPRLPAAVTWLQLPDAGVDRWLRAGVLTPGRVVTSARGLYGQQVAEHAVALLLACTRRLVEAARKGVWAPEELRGRMLSSLNVAVVGSGDIGRALLPVLLSLKCRVVMVNRSGTPVEGAALTLPSTRLLEALTGSDALVLAVPSTAETVGMIDAAALACLRPSSVLVNVGRGDAVVSGALLRALDNGPVAAAALDVTDPEPLPVGDPLWQHPRVLITPHTANPPEAKLASLARRVRDNSERFARGQELVDVVETP